MASTSKEYSAGNFGGYRMDPQDPNDVVDYVIDWSQWLQSGETIVSYTIGGEQYITIDSDALINTSTALRIWTSGGTANQLATFTVQITTDSSPARKDSRTLYIPMRHK